MSSQNREYDALQMAIQLRIEHLNRELRKPFRFNENSQLSCMEYGRREQIKNEIENLKRWRR